MTFASSVLEKAAPPGFALQPDISVPPRAPWLLWSRCPSAGAQRERPSVFSPFYGTVADCTAVGKQDPLKSRVPLSSAC